MSRSELTHAEAEELLAAYALDAVDGDEAVLLEDHLRGCPRCRAELEAHRETAAFLAGGHVEPPSELWDRVAGALDEAPPPLDLSRFRTDVPRRRPAAPGWLAAAAALVVVAALGAVAVRQERDLDRVQAALDDRSLAAAALAAFDDPGSREAVVRSADGRVELRAVVLPDGTGYVLAGSLPPLRAGRTYQLWSMVGGVPVSAGVLGRRPAVVSFHVDGSTTALAVSEEPEGGVRAPTSAPIAVGELGA